MKGWRKEPLLHFLLAGAVVFCLHAWLRPAGGGEPRVVHLAASEVRWLEEAFTRQWRRPPEEAELRGAVADYLREELLAREARELGLDRDDGVVRRRLAQKMEFLVRDTTRIAEPSEDELRRHYDANRELYRISARVWLTQIQFASEAAARRGLESLAVHGAGAAGEPSLLEREHPEADESVLASQFGPEFARRVLGLEPGRWHGPIASPYGLHLVRVSQRRPPESRPFDSVRAEVAEHWQREKRAQAEAQFVAGLLDKYEVVVEDEAVSQIGPLAEVGR